MTNFQKKIIEKVYPKMKESYGYSNVHMLPKIEKVVVNVGIRSDVKDSKVIEAYISDIAAITGQMPIKCVAKKSISSFKVREGQVNGLKVTLRGKLMYEFLEKLFNVTLARVRDFRGLEEKSFDRKGNLSIGLKDQLPFPEISAESVAHLFGMQITVSVSSRSAEESMMFLKLAGLPIKSKQSKK